MPEQHSSEAYLQAQIKEVIALLQRQQVEDSLLQRQPGGKPELQSNLLHKQQDNLILRRFHTMRPADIAYILEALPLEQRIIVWDVIKASCDGQILLELSDAVRKTLISGMEPEELVSVTGTMDTDEIADLAPDLPLKAMRKILRSLNSKKRQHLHSVMAFNEDQVGAYMDFGMITVFADMNLKAIRSFIRKKGKLPEHTDKFFVLDKSNKVIGILPLQTLLLHAPASKVADLMQTEFDSFQELGDANEAARAFERYNLISAPVVDQENRIQGRLCVDTIMDYLRDASDENLLNQAGMEEPEDLFSGIWESAKNRWVWLIINIMTAFAATRIIGLFEDVILEIVALASLMPIIAATGGNTGNQTSMLIIRSLTLGQINRANIARLIRKELGLGLLNGTFLGSIIAILVYLLYRDVYLALVMGLAMLCNLLVSVFVGLAVPLLRYKLGKDPVVGTSIILTFVIDAMGFLILLLLAKSFLL